MKRIVFIVLTCFSFLQFNSGVVANTILLHEITNPEREKEGPSDPQGFPVYGADGDTLFLVYSRFGQQS